MSAKREIGTPSDPVAPSGTQVPEPQLWPLLYDLNGKVTRIDEAVDGLKDRVNSLDSRLEALRVVVQSLANDISTLKGSLDMFKWVVLIVIPILVVLLQILAKHFGL